MPSPFPGMDPYLEAPDIWPDFQHALAVGISRKLNEELPDPYYATARRVGSEGEIRHLVVEIRQPRQAHKVITVIDFPSPTNKQSGPDRDAYRRKQDEILGSDASLIEIDLLRAGERILPDSNVGEMIAAIQPPPAYLVLVNRAWRRPAALFAGEVFPGYLRDWLPCFPVPLKEGEPEVPLDLQYVVNRAYDGGPYRRGAVDYSTPPETPLAGDDADWAAERVRAALA